MKYDSQITELKNLLPTAKNILIALPSNPSIDSLASALALFLTLEASGKQVSIVSDETIKVAQAGLFGIDHIQKNVSSTEGGNLTLSLEGVAASDGTVPALEKLDWAAEGNNLNLVFHVLPGQTFQPTRIVPHYQGSGFSLIFVIGALNLNALGNIYSSNPQIFSGTHVVNIDNQVGNTSFGQTNVLDTQSSSLSEIMVNLIADLGYSLDADSASNLLAGIFESTANLSDQRVTADTFMAVANCLRVGGRKPGSAVQAQPQPQVENVQPAYDWSALMPASPAPRVDAGAQRGEPKPEPFDSAQGKPVSQPQVEPASQPDPASSDFAMPNVVENTPSPEELPSGEGVISENPEPDWLTPKIFKGSSIG